MQQMIRADGGSGDYIKITFYVYNAAAAAAAAAASAAAAAAAGMSRASCSR
jgi:hypothetical protein